MVSHLDDQRHVAAMRHGRGVSMLHHDLVAHSRNPAFSWMVFTVASLGALLLALGGLGAGIDAAHPAAGDTRGGDIAGALVCAVLAALLMWVAVVFEHRARHTAAALDPAAQLASSANLATAASPVGAAQRGFHGVGDRAARVGRRHNSPAAAVVALVVLFGCAAGFWAAAVVKHGDAEQSQRTQHASSVPAVVESVHVTRHTTRSGHYYTTSAPLELLTPVDGRTTTTLHLHGAGSGLVVSADVMVRLDPTNPGYAELPGEPYNTTSQWVALLCMALFFTALLAVLLLMTVHLLRQHRALRVAHAVLSDLPRA